MNRLFRLVVALAWCGCVVACGGATFTILETEAGSGSSSGGGSGSGSSSGSGSGSGSGGGSSGAGSSSGGADGGPFFWCGSTLKCNSLARYCQIIEGGAVQLDGATNISYSCQAYPAKCTLDHTCKCIEGNAAGGQCTESSGEVTVTLFAP